MTTPTNPPTLEQVLKSKQRAIHEGVQVLELQAGKLYSVPAKSRPGYAYLVTVQDAGLGTLPICNCPGFEHRSCCKHSAAVAILIETEQDIRQLEAEQLASIMPQLAFVDDSFCVGAYTVTVKRGDGVSRSTSIQKWSIKEVHERLLHRYWPDQI